MAKASKKRAKKSAKKKSVAKRRKSSRKGKSAPKKSSRKSVKRRPGKKAPAKKAPPKTPEPAWPVLFATILAIVTGLAAAWVLADFSMAANAAAFSPALTQAGDAMSAAAYACDVQAVQTADIPIAETWLALAHPGLVPTLR